MDGDNYFQSLIQQGFSETDAAHYTTQYYPDFQAPMQGLGLPTPPPPGSMELAGAGAQGLGFAGATAGSVAAAGGGMSMKTIVIVSVLVLGGGGTAGYFIYDYLTEPDFYGEVYWSEWGFGYSFEEDAMFIVYPQTTEGCDEFDMFDEDDELGDVEKKDGLCFIETIYDELTIEDEGNFFRLCMSESGEEMCSKIYPQDRGIVISSYGFCQIMVSDIEEPTFNVLEESGYEEFEDWKDNFDEISEEIRKEGPSFCDVQETFGEYETLDMYQFSDRDAVGQMSNASDDDLVHIQMTQGDDLSWAVLKISIVVDDGPSMTCDEASNADANSDCIFTTDEDNYWSTSEEITISEGAYDLCDGRNGGCEIDVTLTKLGVGNEDDKVLYSFMAYAYN